MKDLRNKEIKVGIVSITAIILLILGISIGKEWNVSANYKIIKFRFNNSGGIEQSAPVFVNGVKRGKVISVLPDEGSVLIKAEIDRIDDLKEDLFAKIGIKEITGGKKIDINSGKSGNVFNPVNEIKGINSPDIGDLVAIVGEMSGDAKSLLKKLDTLLSVTNSFLLNKNNIKKIENILTNTDELFANLNSFTNKNKNNLNQIILDLKNLTSDINNAYIEYKPKFDSTYEKVQITLSDADSVMKSANNLLSELNKISNDIKNKKGMVSKLIYDEKFASKLDSTLIKLSEFIEQIKKYGININARLGTRP